MTDRLTADCSASELLRNILAERLRLELRNRLSPIDGLAIHSNTIMGPFHELFTYRRHSDRVQKLASLAGLEPAIKGYKSRMLGALRVSQSYPHIPSAPYLTFIYCNLFRTSRTHSVWFLSLRDCYCNILLMPYLTYSMLLYLPLHYNEIKLAPRVRIELT